MARLLDVPRNQLLRWETTGYPRRLPPATWKRVEHVLALGQAGASLVDDPIVYVLAQPSGAHLAYLRDQEQQVLVFVDGGLAAAAERAMCAFDFDVHAVPVRMNFLEDELDRIGGRPIHADRSADGTAGQQFLAMRALLFEHLASVSRGWLFRVQKEPQVA